MTEKTSSPAPKDVFHVHGALTKMSSMSCQKQRAMSGIQGQVKSPLSRPAVLAHTAALQLFCAHFQLPFITSRPPSSSRRRYTQGATSRVDSKGLSAGEIQTSTLHAYQLEKREPLFIKFKSALISC